MLLSVVVLKVVAAVAVAPDAVLLLIFIADFAARVFADAAATRVASHRRCCWWC